jgi:hypothetical protein
MSSNDLAAERIAQSRLDVAVLVPCYNEERAIAKAVADFRAALSTGLMVLACLSVAVGLILDKVTRGRREAKLIAYLALCALGEERRRG